MISIFNILYLLGGLSVNLNTLKLLFVLLSSQSGIADYRQFIFLYTLFLPEIMLLKLTVLAVVAVAAVAVVVTAFQCRKLN